MENKNEIWKAIPGYEGLYQVSNFGRVKSLDRIIVDKNGREYKLKGRILKPGLDTHGYYYVILYKNNKHKTIKIHKLVAIAFLNHIPNGHAMVVDHIDNDPLNNRLDNLQLINHRENSSKDKFRNNYSSKFIGVSWESDSNKWKSKISINDKQINLGRFVDEETASEHYQIALLILDKFKNNKQFRELVKQIYYTKI